MLDDGLTQTLHVAIEDGRISARMAVETEPTAIEDNEGWPIIIDQRTA